MFTAGTNKHVHQPALWGTGSQSIYQRFQGKKGRELRNHVDSIYVLGTVPGADVPLMRAGGVRTLFRADCNKPRGVQSLIDQYAPRMYSEGIQK